MTNLFMRFPSLNIFVTNAFAASQREVCVTITIGVKTNFSGPNSRALLTIKSAMAFFLACGNTAILFFAMPFFFRPSKVAWRCQDATQVIHLHVTSKRSPARLKVGQAGSHTGAANGTMRHFKTDFVRTRNIRRTFFAGRPAYEAGAALFGTPQQISARYPAPRFAAFSKQSALEQWKARRFCFPGPPMLSLPRDARRQNPKRL